MRQHTEGNNLLLLAQILELDRVVALVAVDYEQPVYPYSARLCMPVKVLQPRNSKLTCRPAVRADTNNPVVHLRGVLVPNVDVVLAGKDREGWDRPTLRVDRFNNRSPLAIAWLDRFSFPASLRACDNQLGAYYTHYKPSLVKVVRVLV